MYRNYENFIVLELFTKKAYFGAGVTGRSVLTGIWGFSVVVVGATVVEAEFIQFGSS